MPDFSLYLLKPLDLSHPEWRGRRFTDPQLAFAHSEREARELVAIALLELVPRSRPMDDTPTLPWSQEELVRETRIREAWPQEIGGGGRVVCTSG